MAKYLNAVCLSVLICVFFMLSGCSNREKVTQLQQLDAKEFAVPTGTVAYDKLEQGGGNLVAFDVEQGPIFPSAGAMIAVLGKSTAPQG